MAQRKRSKSSGDDAGAVPAPIETSAAGRPRWTDLKRTEQISVVCRYFCEGLRLAEVADRISSEYATSFSRESTYPMLMEAVRNEWIRFVPPFEQTLTKRIKNAYPWLRDAEVVHTTQFEDVAHRGAEMLITLLKHMKHVKEGPVHIGFAGGHAMRRLAQILARLLGESEAELPPTLVLHALVAGFEVFDPTTDPNTFFTLFQTQVPFGTTFEFVGLHAPTVVPADQYDCLRETEGIRESYEEVGKLDLIVTSAATWKDKDSTFRKRMVKSEDCKKALSDAQCVGDMLWLPLGPQGPLNPVSNVRTMALVQLQQLPVFLSRGTHVLLVLGPCAACQEEKSEILRAILAPKEHLISHLVVDSRSAREVLR
jgi:DNA-binding transcriptional regulator LsrR (DeoR family)